MVAAEASELVRASMEKNADTKVRSFLSSPSCHELECVEESLDEVSFISTNGKDAFVIISRLHVALYAISEDGKVTFEASLSSDEQVVGAVFISAMTVGVVTESGKCYIVEKETVGLCDPIDTGVFDEKVFVTCIAESRMVLASGLRLIEIDFKNRSVSECELVDMPQEMTLIQGVVSMDRQQGELALIGTSDNGEDVYILLCSLDTVVAGKHKVTCKHYSENEIFLSASWTSQSYGLLQYVPELSGLLAGHSLSESVALFRRKVGKSDSWECKLMPEGKQLSCSLIEGDPSSCLLQRLFYCILPDPVEIPRPNEVVSCRFIVATVQLNGWTTLHFAETPSDWTFLDITSFEEAETVAPISGTVLTEKGAEAKAGLKVKAAVKAEQAPPPPLFNPSVKAPVKGEQAPPPPLFNPSIGVSDSSKPPLFGSFGQANDKAKSLSFGAFGGSSSDNNGLFGSSSFGSSSLGKPAEGGGLFGASSLGKPAEGTSLFGTPSLKKPAEGAGLFGTSALGKPAEGGGLFGASALGKPTEGAGLFGASSLGKPAEGGLFGASPSGKPAEGTSLFGTPTLKKPAEGAGLFGESSLGKPAEGGGLASSQVQVASPVSKPAEVAGQQNKPSESAYTGPKLDESLIQSFEKQLKEWEKIVSANTKKPVPKLPPLDKELRSGVSSSSLESDRDILVKLRDEIKSLDDQIRASYYSTEVISSENLQQLEAKCASIHQQLDQVAFKPNRKNNLVPRLASSPATPLLTVFNPLPPSLRREPAAGLSLMSPVTPPSKLRRRPRASLLDSSRSGDTYTSRLSLCAVREPLGSKRLSLGDVLTGKILGSPPPPCRAPTIPTSYGHGASWQLLRQIEQQRRELEALLKKIQGLHPAK